MPKTQQDGKNVLIISPELWDGHFVSKHHYAETLAHQGNKVYFLDPPVASFINTSVEQTQYSQVWSVRAPIVAKGLRFYPAFVRRKLEARWLKKLEKQIGSTFSTVWLFENSRFYDMRFAGDRLKIYHQVDLNQNFHVREAATSADICFCTTDHIRQEILPYNEKVYKIHHAVASYEVRSELSAEQESRFEKDRVDAAYVGNLKMSYLDVDLLANTVREFPKVMFHFVGTCKGDEPLYLACQGLENICWWGRVDSSLIPSILERSDVLLLTYQKEHYLDQASPHKVMEYLASGKVTVATYTDEYKDKPELLEMVDEPEDYIVKFQDVVTNIDVYNSITKQEARKAFANDNTYSKQLDRIITILNKHNLKL